MLPSRCRRQCLYAFGQRGVFWRSRTGISSRNYANGCCQTPLTCMMFIVCYTVALVIVHPLVLLKTQKRSATACGCILSISMPVTQQISQYPRCSSPATRRSHIRCQGGLEYLSQALGVQVFKDKVSAQMHSCDSKHRNPRYFIFGYSGPLEGLCVCMF